jgi:hypothetical protein
VTGWSAGTSCAGWPTAGKGISGPIGETVPGWNLGVLDE